MIGASPIARHGAATPVTLPVSSVATPGFSRMWLVSRFVITDPASAPLIAAAPITAPTAVAAVRLMESMLCVSSGTPIRRETDPPGARRRACVANRPCGVKLALTERAGRVPLAGRDTPGAVLLWRDTLGKEAADMDSVRPPARLAANGVASRLPHRAGPGPVMAGQPGRSGNLPHFGARRELAG